MELVTEVELEDGENLRAVWLLVGLGIRIAGS
jgi:hypothetical protein